MIWIRISDPIDHSDHKVSKEWMKTLFAKINQFRNLMPQIDPSDLGSLILVWIIPRVHIISSIILVSNYHVHRSLFRMQKGAES